MNKATFADGDPAPFFANKTFLITGGTGFMGKLLIYWLVAKVPDVAKIYVLARKDPQKEGICVEDRLSEILASPPFDSLRAKISNFEQEMAQKIIIVKANLMEKGLGLESNAKQKLIEEVQILIHAAASSDWQESLQTSFRCNVVASLELMELAHQMLKLCVFLHVSSAFFMGRPLDSKIEERVYPLPFDAEMMYKKLCDCPADKMDKEWTKLQPIFHTTHSFTKALIEVLLDNRRQNIPLAIIRPTILGATYREPFPGWVDSLNVIGVLFIYTALGIVQILPGRLDYTLDIVPCDYVVHAIFSIIFQLKSNSSKDDGEFGPASQVPIFFISSSSNPLTWKFAIGTMQKYWQSTLPAKPQGSPKISVYRNYLFYQVKLFFQYKIPSRYYSVLAYLDKTNNYQQCADRKRDSVFRTQQLAFELLPFITYKWNFDTTNFCRLHQLDNSDNAATLVPFPSPDHNAGPTDCQYFKDTVYFDWNSIDWHSFIYYYCWGLLTFLLKQEVEKPTERQLRYGRLSLVDLDGRGATSNVWFRDLAFAYTSSKYVDYPSISQQREICTQVLNSDGVLKTIQRLAADNSIPEDALLLKAKKILERMAVIQQKKYIKLYAWIFRKLWRRIYQQIDVNENVLCRLLEYVKQGPVMLVPSHRSYVDFLITCFVFFGYNIPVPMTAAGEDFLALGFVSTMLRFGGAFFLRRTFRDDVLYSAIFSEYVRQLVSHGFLIQFFIEGRRSRSGKMLHPKLGMMKCVTDCFFDGQVKDIFFCPININYERVIEDISYTNEWLGKQKKKETLENLIKASSVLLENYGRISIKLGQPIPLSLYTMHQTRYMNAKNHATGPREFNPFVNQSDRKASNLSLSYSILWCITLQTVWSPLSIVGSAILSFGSGTSKNALVRRVDWVISELLQRKLGCEDWILEHSPQQVTKRALECFPDGITQRDTSVTLADTRFTLAIAFYRNQLLYLFARDAYIMASYLTLSNGEPSTWVSLSRLKAQTEFLSRLIGQEFIYKIHPDADEELDQIFSIHFQRKWLEKSSGFLSDQVRLGTSKSASEAFYYFPSLIRSIIDCYWVMALAVTAIRPRQVQPHDWLQTVYEIADQLYSNKKLTSLEACTRETLKNSMDTLLKLNVLEFDRPSGAIGVSKEYAVGDRLFLFFQNVTACRWTDSMLLEKSEKLSLEQKAANYVSELPMHHIKL